MVAVACGDHVVPKRMPLMPTVSANYMAGVMANHAGDPGLAEPYFQRAMLLAPEPGPWLQVLPLLLARDAAAATLLAEQFVARHGFEADAWLWLGRVVAARQPARARAAFAKARALAPADERGYLWELPLAPSLEQRHGLLAQLLRRVPASVQGAQAWCLHLAEEAMHAATQAAAAHRLPACERAVARALELDPLQLDARLAAADLALLAGDYDLAVARLRQVWDRAGGDAWVGGRLLRVLATQVALAPTPAARRVARTALADWLDTLFEDLPATDAQALLLQATDLGFADVVMVRASRAGAGAMLVKAAAAVQRGQALADALSTEEREALRATAEGLVVASNAALHQQQFATATTLALASFTAPAFASAGPPLASPASRAVPTAAPASLASGSPAAPVDARAASVLLQALAAAVASDDRAMAETVIAKGAALAPALGEELRCAFAWWAQDGAAVEKCLPLEVVAVLQGRPPLPPGLAVSRPGTAGNSEASVVGVGPSALVWQLAAEHAIVIGDLPAAQRAVNHALLEAPGEPAVLAIWLALQVATTDRARAAVAIAALKEMRLAHPVHADVAYYHALALQWDFEHHGIGTSAQLAQHWRLAASAAFAPAARARIALRLRVPRA